MRRFAAILIWAVRIGDETDDDEHGRDRGGERIPGRAIGALELRLFRAQAFAGLGRNAEAEEILKSILGDDCNNIKAADLLEEINSSRTGGRCHA